MFDKMKKALGGQMMEKAKQEIEESLTYLEQKVDEQDEEKVKEIKEQLLSEDSTMSDYINAAQELEDIKEKY